MEVGAEMNEETSEKLRLCYTCGIEKSHEEMVKGAGRKDGIRSLCKECRRKISRDIRERKAQEEGREMIPYKEKIYCNLSDEELLAFLPKFQKNFGRPPTAGDLDGLIGYPHYRTFYRRFNFKTENGRRRNWNDILRLAGVSPFNQRELWIAWEYLVTLACEAIYKDCIYQSSTMISNYRPDVLIEREKLVVDAATSNYIHRHKQRQYDKAVQAGYRVEYWCLYKISELGIKGEKLTYVFLDEIIERLKDVKANYIIEEMHKLYEQYEIYAEKVIQQREQYIKGKLQEAFQILGRPPRTDELSEMQGMPSLNQITRIFTTYNKALKFAGIPIGRKTIPIYREEIAIQELMDLSNRLGRVPTYRELNAEKLTYTCKVYKKYFGGIKKCLEQQGIDTEQLDKQYRDAKKQLLVDEVIKFYEQYNRMPLAREFNERKELPSHNWVRDHFGGIESLMLIITATEA